MFKITWEKRVIQSQLKRWFVCHRKPVSTEHLTGRSAVDCGNGELTVTYTRLSGSGDGPVSKMFALQV